MHTQALEIGKHSNYNDHVDTIVGTFMIEIGKREFIHHTSKYLKAAESGQDLIITHNGAPRLKLIKIKKYTLSEFFGFAKKVEIIGDINETILGDFFDDLT